MSANDVHRSSEPSDRMTRLCEAMTLALEAHPEYAADVKCAIFLSDDHRGGLVLHGYDDDTDAIVDLFGHVQAIFRANGGDLDFIGIPDDVSGIDE